MSEYQYGLSSVKRKVLERRLKAYLRKHPEEDIVRGRCVLSTGKMLKIVLLYTWENTSQSGLADRFKVSQSTVSRTIRWLIPVLGRVLACHRLTLDDLDRWLDEHPHEPVLVDGTLLPIARPRQAHKDYGRANYSGKHQKHGKSTQVVTTTTGSVLYVSEPQDGRVHDRKAFSETGLEAILEKSNRQGYGDRGYQGTCLTTPAKKSKYHPLTIVQKESNKVVNSIRAAVERGISHLKKWNILSQPNRLRWSNRDGGYAAALALVVGLYGFKRSCK